MTSTDETLRSVELTRLEQGRYRVTNARGGTLELGQGTTSSCSARSSCCSPRSPAAPRSTSTSSPPSAPSRPRFDVRMSGDKVRDELGNRLVDLLLELDVEFPDDEAGQAAHDVLPRAVRQSHDRLCTVSRTVEIGTPVKVRVG